MSALLSLKPAFQILRSFFVSPEPVSLRELSYRSGLQLRSTQLAVEKLLQAGLIKRRETEYRTFFELEPSHPEYEPLKAYFATAVSEELRRLAQTETQAQQMLNAINSIYLMSREMKNKAHGLI